MKKNNTFKVGNLTRPTPKKMRKLGTAILAVSAGAPMVINQFTFDADWKMNIIAIIGVVGLLAKGLTTFFAEE